MAHLEETAVWTPGVYQLETTDPVLGGPVQPAPATGGIANRQALALANRTAYLKEKLQATQQNLSDGLQNVADAIMQTNTDLQAQILFKANIDSPVLTGTPTAPTPAAADNSNRIATTAHVQAALLAQITASLARVCSIHNMPTTNIGPVIVVEASEIWIWVSTAYYTGYRSPLCGRPADGHTVSPLASEIDATGGLVSKTAYAGLWAYAQENNLVISQSVWADNIGGHYFVDVSNTQLRVPDLRNQFRRYTGTNADNAYARALGSLQADAFKSHTHALSAGSNALQTSATPDFNDVGRPGVTNTGCETQPAGGAETRGRNTAFHPRIHV